MGKIKQGILGGFSGKVGPVIGTSWKGKAVMKAQALSVKNPNTEAQQTQRNKISVLSKFLSKVVEALRVGFKNLAIGETSSNVAMRINLEEAVSTSGTAAEIDFTKVVLAQGELLNPSALAAVADTAQGAHNVKVSWTDNTGQGKYEKGSDIVMIVLYNTDKNKSLYQDSTTRSALSASVGHPADWAGDECQVYVVTHQADGKMNSDSIRVGAVTCL